MNSFKFLSLVLMLTLSLSACNSGNSGVLPVADAGVDKHLKTGATVTLDASNSTDAQHDTLTYSWTVDSVPRGSAAILSDDKSSHPAFTADLDGAYKFSLIVNDGKYDSRASTVTITATANFVNALPVAHAGIDQHVKATSPHNSGNVFLDGSRSSDADKEHLNFQWRFKSKPTGSVAVLANASLSHAEFVADIAGTYEVDLIVNDGTDNSIADTISIIAKVENSAPIAFAGVEQHLKQGVVALVNASGSTDADHDSLTYTWYIQSKPPGSSAALTIVGINNALAHITLDVEGSYVLKLLVNDGLVDSVADTVTLTASSNSTPLAIISASPFYEITEQASLNANSSSDADNGTLIYKWHIKHKPATSTVTLSSATAEITTFVLDKNGIYVIELTVNDGVIDSAPVEYTISTRMTEPVLRMLVETYNLKNIKSIDASHEATKIVNADTLEITDMHALFLNKNDVNLDISGWNTSKVLNMGTMFVGATSFNQDLSGWNVDNVMNHYIFATVSSWPADRKPVFKDAVTIPQLAGVWSKCFTNGPFFIKNQFTFREDESASHEQNTYLSLSDCLSEINPIGPPYIDHFTYDLLRKDIHDEKLFPEIKEVQYIDMLFTPSTRKNIIAINGTTLYFGQSFDDRSLHGAENIRPTTLAGGQQYEKQP